jgi:hypothetical protein
MREDEGRRIEVTKLTMMELICEKAAYRDGMRAALVALVRARDAGLTEEGARELVEPLVWKVGEDARAEARRVEI